MAIPISYNVRNMKLRKGLTIMTALGIALTVTTAIFIMALLAGLQKAFVTSGNPLNVLVMRKGSTSELTGPFPSENFGGHGKKVYGRPGTRLSRMQSATQSATRCVAVDHNMQ